MQPALLFMFISFLRKQSRLVMTDPRSRRESVMNITMFTTKNENLECHSEESAFADDRRISDNSAELSTEILR
jgi:hypothetical protein